MKCPLMLEAWHTGGTAKGIEPKDCLEEECAWWTPLSSCCAIRDLPGILIALGNTLGEMAEELHVDITGRR